MADDLTLYLTPTYALRKPGTWCPPNRADSGQHAWTIDCALDFLSISEPGEGILFTRSVDGMPNDPSSQN